MNASKNIALGEMMASKLGSVDPSKFTEEIFDLYSIPAFDNGEPEIVAGAKIGSVKQIVQPGDVLLSKIVPHIRRTWIVGEHKGRRIIASGEWIVFRSRRIEPRYLRHILVSDIFHAQFMRTVSGVGGSLLRARPAQVASIEITLPTLEEQERIAEVLDRAEELRSKRREAIAQLDTLTQAIFLEMFGDPVTNSKGWTSKALTDVCYCYSGGTPSKSNDAYWQGTLPWFSAKDLKLNDLFDSQDHINEDIPAKTTLRLLPENTVVIVVRGMILAHTFPISVLRVPATINQDLKALLPNETLEAQFLAASLRSVAAFALQQVSEAAHGTKRLDAEGLRKIPIILPPLALQKEFAQRVEAVEKLQASHRASLSELDALFASLQHRAFRGEL